MTFAHRKQLHIFKSVWDTDSLCTESGPAVSKWLTLSNNID